MYVFVYGTLTEPARVASVVDSYVFVGPAVCEGLHPVEGSHPTLVPGGEVAGRLLRTDEIDALDAYEGVDEGLYVRVSLPYRGPEGPEAVETYVGDPGALGVADSDLSHSEGALAADTLDAGVDAPDVATDAPADARAEDATSLWPGEGSLAERVRRYVDRERPFVRPTDATDGRTTGV